MLYCIFKQGGFIQRLSAKIQLILPLIRSVARAALVAVVLLSIIALPATGRILAATVQELGTKKTELQKKLEQVEKDKQESLRKKKEEEKKKAEFDQARATLERNIAETENQINKTQHRIDDTLKAIAEQEQRIEGKQNDITHKEAEFHEAVAEDYMTPSSGTLYAVLGTNRISSAFDQIEDLRAVSDLLIKQGEDLEKEKGDLLAQKAKLEQQKQDYQTTEKQLEAYKRAADAQRNQKAKLAEQAKAAANQAAGQAAEAQKSIDTLKKQFAAVAAEEAAMRRAASKRPSASAVRGNAPPSSYGLVWPAEGYISTYFGGSTPFQNFHTGLDVAGPAGDPIRAAAAGSVTLATIMCCSSYSGNGDGSYGYGRYVMIKQDNGLVTLYAHLMESLVSPGDRVERGQIIGYRGGGRGMSGAGWSTGPHLHFEVRDASGPDDPLKYLP